MLALKECGWSVLDKGQSPCLASDTCDPERLQAMWAARCQIVRLDCVQEWHRWLSWCHSDSMSRVLFIIGGHDVWDVMLGMDMDWRHGQFNGNDKKGAPLGWICLCHGYSDSLKHAVSYSNGVVSAVEAHMSMWEPQRKYALNACWVSAHRVYPTAGASGRAGRTATAGRRTALAQVESLPEGISFCFETPREDITPEIKQAIRRLHLNTGHGAPHDMARMIRMAGGSRAAVDCAKGLRCSTCARHARPGRPSPAHIPEESRQFNDRVQLDLYCVTDVEGLNYWGLLVCDSYTGFVSGCLVPDHSSVSLWRAYRECWLQWAGPPMCLVGDQERGFESEDFIRQACQSGSRVDPAAPYAPWQKSKVERNIESVKEIIKKSVSHCQAKGQEEMDALMREAGQALNRKPNYTGYSPSMLVFGTHLRLYGELHSPAGPLIHLEGTEDTQLLRRLKLRETVNQAVERVHAKDLVRRAVAAKTRHVLEP
eukprot:807786-Amphidinium_carterae.1